MKLKAFLAFIIMLFSVATLAAPPADMFSTVKNMNELQQKLKAAKNARTPVMIEFIASWCPACRALDNDVLSDGRMQRRLSAFEKIRIDITEKSHESVKLIEHYHVYVTPTLVFIDKNGRQFDTDALNGGVTKEALASVLEQLA